MKVNVSIEESLCKTVTIEVPDNVEDALDFAIDKAKEMYSTIIFDSIEPAANYCQEYICQKYGEESIASGRGGFGLWKEYGFSLCLFIS